MPASDHRARLTIRVRRDGDYWLATARGQYGTGETRCAAVREYDGLRAWAGEGAVDGS